MAKICECRNPSCAQGGKLKTALHRAERDLNIIMRDEHGFPVKTISSDAQREAYITYLQAIRSYWRHVGI